MTQDPAAQGTNQTAYQRLMASSHYGLLGVLPSASVSEIRQAYRDLSKRYHPDTTELPADLATAKFQALNEAYATLAHPEKRLLYDQKIGYSKVLVVQSAEQSTRSTDSSSAYLDATDRPLSAGEIFALFILGLTFVICLAVALAIGFTRTQTVLHPGTPAGTPMAIESVPIAAQKLPLPLDQTSLNSVPSAIAAETLEAVNSPQPPTEATVETPIASASYDTIEPSVSLESRTGFPEVTTADGMSFGVTGSGVEMAEPVELNSPVAAASAISSSATEPDESVAVSPCPESSLMASEDLDVSEDPDAIAADSLPLDSVKPSPVHALLPGIPIDSTDGSFGETVPIPPSPTFTNDPPVVEDSINSDGVTSS